MLYLDRLNIDTPLLVVRDDLFPYLYGGNKARKSIEYEIEMTKHGYDAMVTTGGIQSNHCRAIALLAAKHHWDCHIVYHGDRERFLAEGGNAKLVRSTSATYEFVSASEISTAMDRAMIQFASNGKKPYYVTGGGHDLPGGIAYVNAVRELVQVLREQGKKIDRIFLPCGTGSTQAGIIVGLYLEGLLDTEVVGISVARNKQRAMEVTTAFVIDLAKHYSISDDNLAKKVIISDDFLFGGYEQTTPVVKNWLTEVIRSTGIIFDTTYSGKALCGMHELIKKNNWEGDNNLFWHTGGIMNFLS